MINHTTAGKKKKSTQKILAQQCPPELLVADSVNDTIDAGVQMSQEKRIEVNWQWNTIMPVSNLKQQAWRIHTVKHAIQDALQ